MIIGRIRDFTRDILSQKQLLTLEVEGDLSELIEKLKNEKLTIDLKKFRKKRSLTANGYYWTLVHQISEANGVPDAWTHNLYLRDCHVLVRDSNGMAIEVLIPDTDEEERRLLSETTYHLCPTSKVENGRRSYLLLKGSSDFDSAEMARLIEFAVQDADQLGIETITPTERQRLIELYGRTYEKATKNKSV